MMQYFKTFIGVLWCLVFFFCAIAISLPLFKRSLPNYLLRRVFAPVFNWLMGIRLQVQGKEQIPLHVPKVYFVNHASFFDIPVILAILPRNAVFILKKELKYVPFIGWFATFAQMFYIDRKDKASSDASLVQIAAQVQKGNDVVIFPEGTRQTTGKIGTIKTGGIRIASDAHAAIVPMIIEGTKEMMPKNSYIFGKKSGTVGVMVTEALYPPENLTVQQMREWQEKIQLCMQTAQDHLQYTIASTIE